MVKGENAQRIMKEIREGTPWTQKREETLARARAVFRASTAKSGWAGEVGAEYTM